jgi:SAM-dependent methyltransferase
MRKIILFFLNNIIINRFLIWIKKDDFIKKYKANWSKTTIDKSKSLQENVGFSHQEDVQIAIDKVHNEVQEVYQKHCSGIGAVLDIGCGVGLYLQDFKPETQISGTDLSADFIEEAGKLLPRGDFHDKDYMAVDFKDKFGLIFSISVLEYIPPSRLASFFRKIKDDLNNGGIMMVQYPHALSRRACMYPDLSYVQYSPLVIEKAVSSLGFEIIKHKHSFDGRDLNFKFDTERYDPENEKSFRNGAIIVARKID